MYRFTSRLPSSPPFHPEQDETKRLYGVYEKHLADGDKQYLVGEKYTIADMCTQPWWASSFSGRRARRRLIRAFLTLLRVRAADWAGVSLAEFPHLSAWSDRIESRPGFQKGLLIPEQVSLPSIHEHRSSTHSRFPALQDSITKLKNDPSYAEKKAQEAQDWVSDSVWFLRRAPN